MTPERWKQVEDLYHTARARPAGERMAFLARACPDDEALRRDVASLLAEPVSGDGVVAELALPRAADVAAGPAPMTDRRIGGYHLQLLLGAGGMGEVYRARDAKLGRDVAIKILPGAFTSDPDRLARFEREARMLAALNHPNICAIYGFEEAEAVRFLILELVDGETLAERLARPGDRPARSEDRALQDTGRGRPSGRPIPLAEALAIARQIAAALDVAHEKGIVHRDLKPANIKITPDGLVKVLDFGLAKAATPDGADAGLTQSLDGGIVGTPAYMSPEQARGHSVDKRADIWAFGCVLFEMLTGRVAFAGETVSDTIAKIIERDPDWPALPAATPPSIRRLLLRCLAKDPKQRLRDIGDVRIEIDAIDDVPTVPPHVTGRPNTARAARLPWVVAGALALALAGSVAWSLRSVPPLAVTRFPLTLPAGQQFDGSGGAHVIALSPNGTQLAYVAPPFLLYLRSMSALDMKAIPGAEAYEGVREPVFSPDGGSIAFYAVADQTLKRITVTGGAATMICPADPPTGISWGADGIVFGQGGKGIMRVSPNAGTPEALVRVKAGEQAHGPQVLPGGQHVLFTLATGTAPNRWDSAHIVVQSLKSGERKTVIEAGSDARYVSTGHLVYALSGRLYAVAFDLQRLALTGDPVPIVDGVSRAAGSLTGAANFSISSTGTLVYVPGPMSGIGSGPVDIALMDRKGSVEPLRLPPGPYTLPRVSPDGLRIAFGNDDVKQGLIWIHDLSGTSMMRQLPSGGSNRFPIWTADGKSVAFQSDREGDLGIFRQAADGTGTAERLTKPDQGTSHVPNSWSPKDDRFLFDITKGSDTSLWAFSLRDKKATPLDGVHSSTPTGAVFSPNGRWVAYSSTERNTTALFVQPFPATGTRHQLFSKASDSPKHPRWSPDGKELFYNPRQQGFEAVSITTEPAFRFGNAVAVPKLLRMGPAGSRTNFDITPGGRFLGLVTAGEKEFLRGSADQIRVVLNWTEELKARVPGR